MLISEPFISMQSIIDQFNIMILGSDAGGMLKLANQQSMTELCLDAQHIGSISIESIIVAPPVSLLTEALNNKQFVLNTQDGRIFFAKGYSTPIIFSDGSRGLFFGLRNIGDNFIPEFRREELQSLIENISDGLLVLSDQLEILLCNHTFEQLSGLSREDIIGYKLSTVLPEIAATGLITRFQYFETEEFVLHNRINSREYMIKASLAPVRTGSFETLGLGITMQDVTREHQLEELKNNFIAHVSHELKTPLTAIKGFSSTLLNREGITEADKRKYLAIIETEANRLNSMIEDLLSLSRIESGRQELNYSTFLLEGLLQQTKEELKTELLERSQCMSIEIGDGTINCRGDRDRLFQVLLNLCANAIKASLPKGEITMRSTLIYQGKFIRISVIDRGVGIAESSLKKIFDEFFSVRHPDQKKPGTGLGLSIVKHIIALHQGSVSVESQPGIETAFHIDLPV